MGVDNFFDEQTVSSKIKASIISEYFPKYCNIIVSKYPPQRVRYIDIFAGPGIYKDGSSSTPLLIAQKVKDNEFLRNNVRMVFNDNKYYKELKINFENRFPSNTFKHKVHFGQSTVGESEDIDNYLMTSTINDKGKNDQPSVVFIDPFGYKGIKTKVLAKFLENWGNEIFLFLNTKRIQAALENDKFTELMEDLFPSSLTQLRRDRRYEAKNVSERLSLIIEKLATEYELLLGQKIYYTAFKFQEEDINTTSHYILHFTKGSRGYDLVKTIYNDFANVGTVFDGVNTYTFDAKKIDNKNIEIFDQSKMNIDKLKKQIYLKYANQTLDAAKLFDEHQIEGLYSRQHYVVALRELVSENKLTSEFIDKKQHKVTVLISKDCILKFR